MKKILVMLMATGVMLGSVGCANQGPVEQFAVMALVKKGTAEYISADTEKAQRIVDEAEALEALMSDDIFTSVDALMVYVRSQIPWNEMDPLDAQLWNDMLDMIHMQLVEELGENPLPEDVRLTAGRFVRWVREAASLYTAAE